MPELDYMVLADYVRQEANGVIHVMGAGVDTITTPTVPSVWHLGVALRIAFDTTERPGDNHSLTVSFVGPDKPVLDVNATFVTPPRPPGVPEHWKTGLGMALQIPVPLPQFGDYSCVLAIDGGAITKSYELRVVQRGAQG
jgi:hypothetical protein